MLKIGETEVEENVAHEKFACVLSECKGACCTMPGGRGAPLTDEEAELLPSLLPSVSTFLSGEHLAAIAQEGVVEGVPGSYATICLNRRACLFVYYQEGVAKCSIERAFSEGKTKFRKLS